MSYVYIGGDSFCHYRSDPELHWPARVAKQLGLELQGTGIPGQCWWHTRQHLVDYIDSTKFDDTRLFIFCHTDQNRILTRNRLQETPGDKQITQVREMYYKYIHDYEISDWVTRQWYLELNQLLAGQTVVHIQCFNSTQAFFPVLEGIKISDPLLDLSLKEIGGKLSSFLNDSRPNHFSPAGNQLVADMVLDKVKGHI